MVHAFKRRITLINKLPRIYLSMIEHKIRRILYTYKWFNNGLSASFLYSQRPSSRIRILRSVRTHHQRDEKIFRELFIHLRLRDVYELFNVYRLQVSLCNICEQLQQCRR